jgi:hypothetical protein
LRSRNADFAGTLGEFVARFTPWALTGARSQILNAVSLRADEHGVRVHCGVLFDQGGATLAENIAQLQALGLHSGIFTRYQSPRMACQVSAMTSYTA